MATRYFKGRSVTGSVEAAPEGSFAEVVDALRICPVLPLKRSAFQALPKARRNELKQVPFFVPATFVASPSKRTYENAVACNLIFIDIDQDPEGKSPAAPFVRNPDCIHTALSGFNFAAHTTASSTEEQPRMRIVVDADQIPIDRYPGAVATIAALLGLIHITTESKVAVQPMFVCTMFSDSTDEDHPLIAHRLDGRAFTVEDITDCPPDAFAHRANGSNGEHPDALNFLRSQVSECTLAIAKDALSALDPDCSYYEWLEVASALRHQFSPHLASEAYELFDEWSSEGSKYQDSDETKAKWDSLRPTPPGRLPVTIRTLLKRAKDAGWNDTSAKAKGFDALTQWFDEVASITELVEQGVKRILATPLLSSTEEDMLVDQMRKVAKQRFAYTISKTAILKDLKHTRDEIREQAKPQGALKEPAWAKGVCYVSAAQEFFRNRTGEKYKAQSFDACYSRHLLPTAEVLKEAGVPVTPAALSRPVVSPTDYALNHLKITTTYDYAYDPSQPSEVFFTYRGRRFVNTYSPTYPEVDSALSRQAGETLQRHLSNLIMEEGYRRVLIDFMAFMVQHPGRKIRWAILIQSAEGAGKSFLGRLMKGVLGNEHVKKVDISCVKSGWNDWAFGYQLVILEEVRVAGTNRHEVMNTLKPLITDDEFSMNEKFRSQREVPNISNYILFTNHHDAIAITGNDRRYFILKSPLQTESQVLALGKGYFSPLFDMLRDHPGAFRSFLIDWPISDDFNPDGRAPKTTYAAEVVQDSASDVTATVRRLVIEGDYPLIQYDIVSAKALMDVISLEERVSAQHLAHVLREEGYRQIGRHLIGEERQYLWIRNGVDEGTAGDEARARLRTGAKNLEMQLFF